MPILYTNLCDFRPKIAQNRTQSHKNWPVYAVQLQVRGVAGSCTMCHFVPIVIRFHMGYPPSGLFGSFALNRYITKKEPTEKINFSKNFTSKTPP